VVRIIASFAATRWRAYISFRIVIFACCRLGTVQRRGDAGGQNLGGGNRTAPKRRVARLSYNLATLGSVGVVFVNLPPTRLSAS